MIKPYIKIDGVPSFKDSEIMALWSRSRQEGFADNLFFDIEGMNESLFFEIMQSDKCWLFVIYNDDKQLCGFSWLTDFRGSKANGHFALFKGFRGKEGVKLVTQTCRDILSIKNDGGRYLFDVIVGATPVSNKPACFLSDQMQKAWGKHCDIGVVRDYLYDYKENALIDAKLCYFRREEREGA